MTSASIRPECVDDYQAIHAVHVAAFGQDGEANLVDTLRAAGFARLGLVAEVDGQIVGHILFSDLPIQTDHGIIEATSLAPVGVVPARQGQGIGSALIRAGLDALREQGQRIVIVLGEPEYYGRFGFSAKLAGALASPFSGPAFQALELVPDALHGVKGQVQYPPPFFEL
ncbi:MAG: GNAT family N-acetyltransferase [Gemmataceae bacterium]